MSDSRRYTWYRQRKKRGFDDRELWSLDHTIAKFVLPRLLIFKEKKIGYPADLTVEKWDSILDQIIYSMEAIIDEWDGKYDYLPSTKIASPSFAIRTIQIQEKKINQGLNLFAKYFRNLWW